MVKIFKPGSRTLAALVAAAALVPALMITSGGTASASDGDPVATGCAADAYTVSSQPVTDNTHIIGRVDLRYSPHMRRRSTRTWSIHPTAPVQPHGLSSTVTPVSIPGVVDARRASQQQLA